MFWPFFQEPPKDDEVNKAGMIVDYAVGGIKVAIEVMQFFDHVVVDVCFEVGVVLAGLVVEGVRVGVIPMLEDAEIFDVLEGLGCDLIDFLVEDVIVGE